MHNTSFKMVNGVQLNQERRIITGWSLLPLKLVVKEVLGVRSFFFYIYIYLCAHVCM